MNDGLLYTDFAAILRDWLTESGMKQKTLAKRSGIAMTRLSWLKSGKIKPNIRDLLRFQAVSAIKFIN